MDINVDFLNYTAACLHNAVNIKWREPLFLSLSLSLITADAILVIFLGCSEAACTWVVPWLRQLIAELSPRRPRFSPRPVYMGSVVEKLTFGQVFLLVLQFSPVINIPPMLHTHTHTHTHTYTLTQHSHTHTQHSHTHNTHTTHTHTQHSHTHTKHSHTHTHNTHTQTTLTHTHTTLTHNTHTHTQHSHTTLTHSQWFNYHQCYSVQA